MPQGARLLGKGPRETDPNGKGAISERDMRKPVFKRPHTYDVYIYMCILMIMYVYIHNQVCMCL